MLITNQLITSILQLNDEMRDNFYTNINALIYDNCLNSLTVLEFGNHEVDDEIKYCPNCQSTDIKGHGIYSNQRRFQCKSCKKTFNRFSQAHTEKINKTVEWNKYIHSIAKGMTLREAAEYSNISYRTAFLWKRKIISALQNLSCIFIEGIFIGKKSNFLIFRKKESN